MYSDPRHIRDHEVKVRLNEDEYALLEALATYNQTQKSVLVREVFVEAAKRLAGFGEQQQLIA